MKKIIVFFFSYSLFRIKVFLRFMLRCRKSRKNNVCPMIRSIHLDEHMSHTHAHTYTRVHTNTQQTNTAYIPYTHTRTYTHTVHCPTSDTQYTHPCMYMYIIYIQFMHTVYTRAVNCNEWLGSKVDKYENIELLCMWTIYWVSKCVYLFVVVWGRAFNRGNLDGSCFFCLLLG